LPKVVPTYTEDAKKRILQAASEEFREKGYLQSTMDGIAKRLGISHGAVYRYYSSKEKILLALYARAPENLRSMFQGALSEEPADALKEVFDKMATKNNARLFVNFLAEASTNVEFQNVLRDSIEKFIDAMEDVIRNKDPKMSSKDWNRVHDSITMLGLIFNGLNCWITVGVPEQEVRKIWIKSVDALLVPLATKAQK
jgi:TetR/AcrR family transcriptional regulator, transcriptional repressor of aconitase